MNAETASAIDNIAVTMDAGGMNTVNIVLAFVMYGIALGIKPHVFKDILMRPKSAIIGVCCQLVLFPFVTFLLALLVRNFISPMMAMGMILVSCCPGGNISNFISSLSKANVELSVSLTAISTLLSIVMTPLNFFVYGNAFIKLSGVVSDIPQLSIPLLDVLRTIFILLGIPIVLGVLTSQYLPKVASALKKPFQWLSIVFFLGLVLALLASNLEAFSKCIKYVFVVVLVHNLFAMLTGFGVGTLFKVPHTDRRTLTIETGIQNSGLGLVLLLGTDIFASFPSNGGMLVITAWWGVWHIISGLAVAGLFNYSDYRKHLIHG